VQAKAFSFAVIVLAFALSLLGNASPAVAQLNVTVVGSLGDLDANGDGGAGEAAVLNAAVACWAARVGTNRNFTLTVMTANLAGGTIGQGATTAVNGAGIPTAGRITMDTPRTYFIDATPIVSTEFQPDPQNRWRFINGSGAATGTDLFSVVTHEIGHALGWLCGGTACAGFTNPNYDALMNPAQGSFVSNTACAAPFPRDNQAPLAGCVHLQQGGGFVALDAALRGDGLGGSGSSVVNELSHPGIAGDLMQGFYTSGTRETQTVKDVNMFAHAYGDAVNLPPTINAGSNIVSECNASGGSNVTLNGNGSTDPEGGLLTYSWTCPSVALAAANSATPSGFFPLNSTTACRLDAGDLVACPALGSTVQVQVRDTTAPSIICPAPITVECKATGGTPAGDLAISAFLGGASATDVCTPSLTISNNAPGFFNSGTTPVMFSTADSSSNPAACSSSVKVVDTTAPTIASVTATPNSLWPPNHQMVPVAVAVSVSDVCDASASCQIKSVASNEPINGLGDGDTSPDWVITGPLTLQLRAERAEKGSGRTYTITVECTDGSGNSSTKTVTVGVTPNQS
jgi:hypothetical protein